MQADRTAALSLRHYDTSGQRRAQDRHHQQRLRHSVRRVRREAGAGMRLCRIRAVRLRLSTLPRRATDDRRVRGFSPQGVARQNRLPQPQSAKTRKSSGWAGRGDRRRHRVLEVGISVPSNPAPSEEGAIAGSSMQERSMRPAKRLTLASVGVTALLWPGMTAYAGSARDYLNAPVDTWLLNYNAGYTTSVTPEDGTDTVPGVRSNVFAQSVVLTRTMDYWGRTGAYRSFCLMRSSTPALARSAPARTAFPMSASFGK